MFVYTIDSTATYCTWALIVLLVYELEAGLQHSDSTIASQTLSTPTASIQELPTNDSPSATPSLSESTPATNQVTTAGSYNTNVETNPA